VHEQRTEEVTTAESNVTTKALDQFTPFDADVMKCPHQYNARMRGEAPIYHCPHTGMFFVFDYATIRKIAGDPETFSNKFGSAMRRGGDVDPRLVEVRNTGYPAVDTMLTEDPPVHRRYRGLVNQAFTARRVATLARDIETIANEMIDAFVDLGTVELVGAFCGPLPLTVIADQLGVPRSDLPLFNTWSDAFVAQLSRMASADEEVEAAKLIVQFQHYFAKKLEERRRDKHDDIISDIVHARLEGERPLDTAESLSIIQQLLVAGNETTTSAIAEGVLLLIRHPEQLAKLRADPGLVPNLVEEVLRLSTPTANMWRVCTKDTDVNGTRIPAGSLIQLRYASADRDERVFDRPQAFDVTRQNARANVAFGYGVHMCIGASLARKEMEVAFRVLLERLDDLTLDGPEDELVYPPNVLLRGLAALPIRFTRR
jgi:cytochrome P450